MRFPVDTSRLKFLVIAAAEELRQFEEVSLARRGAPRKDAHGQMLGLRLGQCVPGRIACGA